VGHGYGRGLCCCFVATTRIAATGQLHFDFEMLGHHLNRVQVLQSQGVRLDAGFERFVVTLDDHLLQNEFVGVKARFFFNQFLQVGDIGIAVRNGQGEFVLVFFLAALLLLLAAAAFGAGHLNVQLDIFGFQLQRTAFGNAVFLGRLLIAEQFLGCTILAIIVVE